MRNDTSDTCPKCNGYGGHHQRALLTDPKHIHRTGPGGMIPIREPDNRGISGGPTVMASLEDELERLPVEL